jgi:hypothetical protein
MITRRQKSAEEQRKMKGKGKGKGKGPDWVYRGWTERTALRLGPPAKHPIKHDISTCRVPPQQAAWNPKSTFSSPKTPRKGMPFATDYKLYKSCSHYNPMSMNVKFVLHFFLGLISKQKWEFKRGEFFLPNCIWDCLNMVHLLDPIAVLPTSTNLGSQDVATWDLQNEHHEGRSWCCRRSLLWSLLSNPP